MNEINLATIQQFIDDNRKWTDEVFPEVTAKNALFHLKTEVKETIEAILIGEPPEQILEEFSDCFLLLTNSLSLQGFSFNQLLEASYTKMRKNRNRVWQKNKDGFYEHIENLKQ